MRLFERVWATLSASRVPPNEQDALNRELAATFKTARQKQKPAGL